MRRELTPDLDALYALAMTSLPAGFLPSSRQPADTLPRVELAPEIPEQCARLTATRTSRHGHAGPGGLFDETVIRQTDLFD